MPVLILYPYYCNKYLDFSKEATVENSGNNLSNPRYSDIYLMRAEALHALTPGSSEAYECVNKVRRRAFGKPIDTPSDIDLRTGLSPEEFWILFCMSGVWNLPLKVSGDRFIAYS